MQVDTRELEELAADSHASRVVAIETVRPEAYPNILFVLVGTADGFVGFGESFYGARAIEQHIHEVIAPVVLGLENATPERVSKLLAPYVGYQGGGAETRANGAIDLALWDLLGKRAGLPLVDLLGGSIREPVRVYNTCAGPAYVSDSTRQESANWGVGRARDYEDLEAFMTRPAELARELLSEGITGMKIWPFDLAAERTGGNDLRAADLEAGIRIVDAIRAAVGDEVDLMIELHSLWDRRCATRLCDALTPYAPFWIEDPLRVDAVDGLATLRRDVDVPLACGETCVGRRGFLPLLERGAIDVATVDIHWTGGLSEARKIAWLADAYAVPVAPHDCTGPVSLAAAVHLVASQANGLIQETVRAFLRTWYREFVDGLPEITDGHIRPSTAPGLGVELRPGIQGRADVVTRVSRWVPGA
jgi:L-alanine-DL-glutamate epimerase-like enolase superfamily enzyme